MSEVKAVFEKLEIDYKEHKGGDELQFKCVHPLHNDRNPSAFINTKTGKWLCFSCGRKGSLVTIIKLVKGQDVDVESFLSRAELLQMQINGIYKTSASNILRYDELLQFQETIDYEFTFFEPVKSNKEALSYLISRGISKDTINDFGLKFAPSGNYRNRIIIPYSKDGQIIGFNSRTIDKNDHIRYLYYLNHDMFKGYIYNYDKIVNYDYCLLVEGPFDLMYSHSIGLKNVISTLNTNVSLEHIREIIKFKKIIFMFDNDINTNAGYKAVIKASQLINSIADKEIFYAELPEGKDPNSCSPSEIKHSLSNLYVIEKGHQNKIIDGLLSFRS